MSEEAAQNQDDGSYLIEIPCRLPPQKQNTSC